MTMKSGTMQRIGIVGAGAWGTALALVLHRKVREVVIWAYEREVAQAINREHANALYLPGVALDPAIRAESELAPVAEADLVLLATPAQHLRACVATLAPRLGAHVPLVICTKGIEQQSAALMSEIAAERLPQAPLAVLSGPSFASEVAAGLPTASPLPRAITPSVRGSWASLAARSSGPISRTIPPVPRSAARSRT